ncbi:MAG: hypothetical protein AB7S46_17440, partial [Flavobacteriaceae bacterium]
DISSVSSQGLGKGQVQSLVAMIVRICGFVSAYAADETSQATDLRDLLGANGRATKNVEGCA